MFGMVLGRRDADQVGGAVVERVLVAVVNVEAVGYRPVGRLPYFLMEALDSTLPVGDSGCEVRPVRPVRGLRVAAESDASEDDAISCSHVRILSW